jgi:DNA-binding transcriptional MocR family regulator
MTVWQPDLTGRRGPIYLAILAALEADIKAGRLQPGERLPTHRDLAHRLGVTVGTVTKAYAGAERRGLVVGRTGRGTFALQFPDEVLARDGEPDEVIDLGINAASVQPFNDTLNRVLGALSRRKSLHGFLEFHPLPGLEHHRAAGAAWIARRGIEATAERTLLCSGAHEGLIAALSVATRPGQIVLAESLAYAGIRRIAGLCRLEVVGVPLDDQGMVPEALEKAADGRPVGAILCQPALHNPTNAVMPLKRRKALAAYAEKAGALIVEDDIYGHLAGDQTPPLAALAPARTLYLCGTSKSIAPGLRIGYLLAPAELVPAVGDALHATSWTSPSLMGEIATMLIRDGTADKFVTWHRQESLARQALARDLLGLGDDRPLRPSYHLWLPLPAPWRAQDFAAELRRAGVLVSPAEAFAVDRSPAPHAVRISLGAVRERARLRDGLERVADLLAGRPTRVRAIA